MIRPTTAVSLMLLSAACTQAAEDLNAADLLPGAPVLTLAVPDWSGFTDAMSASGLGDFWRDAEIQGLIARLMEEPKKDFEEAMDELGLEPEDLEYPRGLVAAGIYLDGGFDPESDHPTHFVLVADYQDGAPQMVDLLERMLEQGEDHDAILVREDTYEDARLWIIEPLEPEADEDAQDDEDEWDDWDEEATPFDYDEVTIALRDGVFVVSADTGRLERTLDALSGDDIDSLADDNRFRDSLAQHPAERHAWGVLSIGSIRDAFLTGMEQGLPPGVDPRAILNTLGLMDIETLSLAMSFAEGDVLMEQTFAVLVPEKRGLVALFDEEGAPFSPPAVVSPDAASVSRFSVNFDGVIQVVRDAMAQLPEAMRGQPEAIFEGMVAPIATPLLASLGRDVWATQGYTTPFSPESEQRLMVMTTDDEGALGDLLVNIPGMEGREFAGAMIYSNPMGADMGVEAPSIGLSAGHVFVGSTVAVENAIRLAANPADASLADEPRFRKGADMLDDRALGFMFTDMAQTYRYLKWSMDNFDQIQRAELEAIGYEGEELDEMMEWMADAKPEWAEQLPSEQLISKYIGDTFGQVQSTDEGFVWTSYWLRGTGD
ncbi:MAG: hypothetical protein ACIARR_02575 [Phycisphaerales bacterium JB059]